MVRGSSPESPGRRVRVTTEKKPHYRKLYACVCASYENTDVALTCGMMLRECFRHEELAKLVLMSESFYKFFDYVELSTFDIASDAFSTFKARLA